MRGSAGVPMLLWGGMPAPVRLSPDPVASSPPRRVQLFVNARAGRWRERHLRALKLAFEEAGATVVVTHSLRESLTIAEGIDHVCAVGGDGTLRHVAAAVSQADPRPSISVYPLGTVNLLARECGYAPGPVAFVSRTTRSPARRQHFIAQINGVPMLTCASVGPDSWTIDRLSPRLKRLTGRAAYLAAFCRVLARWPRQSLRVVSGGDTIDCEAVYVAKGRYFAGPWSIAPAAVDDPLLHVVALRHADRRAFLRFAWSILRGRDPEGAIRFTCSSLTISGTGAAPVQADGDIVAHLPATISVAATPLTFH